MVTETPVTEKQRMPVPEQSMIVESSEAPEIVTLPFVAWEELTCTLQLDASVRPMNVREGSEMRPLLLRAASSTMRCTVCESVRGATFESTHRSSKKAQVASLWKANGMAVLQLLAMG
jgi:hypothetical protein